VYTSRHTLWLPPDYRHKERLLDPSAHYRHTKKEKAAQRLPVSN
jgi:hypothetical protein